MAKIEPTLVVFESLADEFDKAIGYGDASMTGSLAWRVVRELRRAEGMRAELERLRYSLEAERQKQEARHG